MPKQPTNEHLCIFEEYEKIMRHCFFHLDNGKRFRDVVANVLDCNIVEREIKLQLYYYIHYQFNIFEKDMNTQLWGKRVAPLFFYLGGFWGVSGNVMASKLD